MPESPKYLQDLQALDAILQTASQLFIEFDQLDNSHFPGSETIHFDIDENGEFIDE